MKLLSLRSAAVGGVLLAASSVAVFGAGYFPNFPIVGGASYCATISGVGNTAGTGQPSITGTPGAFGQGNPLGGVGTGANQGGNFNAVCNNFVPAGPSALTGNELVPADTQLPSGQVPQTVTIPASILASGGVPQVITTNTALVINNGVDNLISNQGTATISSITLPAAPWNGQLVTITNAGSGVLTITSIAANSGQSIVQGAAAASLAIQTNNSAAAALSSTAYRYNAANTTWYRVL